MIILVLIGLQAFVFFLYLFFLRRFHVSWHRTPDSCGIEGGKKTTFSIVVPFRNEAAHIVACIQSILNNNYPPSAYEIICVDDDSTDGSGALLTPLEKGNVRLIRSSQIGKKSALSTGIASAQFDFILTTDADCVVGPDWLNGLNRHIQHGQLDVCVGMVGILPGEGILNDLQFFDFCATMSAGHYGVSNRSYFLCNGANFAFRRSLFYSVGGYDGNRHIASGDDVFLIKKFAAEEGVEIGFCRDVSAAVWTKAEPTLTAFLNQRKRWATKTRAYAGAPIVFIQSLAFLVAGSVLLNLLILVGQTNFYLGGWTAVLLAGKMMADGVFLAPLAKTFGRKWKPVTFILTEIAYLFYILYAGVAALFPSNTEWKGRR